MLLNASHYSLEKEVALDSLHHASDSGDLKKSTIPLELSYKKLSYEGAKDLINFCFDNILFSAGMKSIKRIIEAINNDKKSISLFFIFYFTLQFTSI